MWMLDGFIVAILMFTMFHTNKNIPCKPRPLLCCRVFQMSKPKAGPPPGCTLDMKAGPPPGCTLDVKAGPPPGCTLDVKDSQVQEAAIRIQASYRGHRYSRTASCFGFKGSLMCMYMCMYVCMHVCIYVCMYVLYTCMHVYMSVDSSVSSGTSDPVRN